MNRYTQLTPAQFDPLSLQEIMMVPLARQQQHDAQQAQIGDMGVQLNALQADTPYYESQVTDFRNRADALTDELMSKGVGRGLTKNLMSLSRDRRNFLEGDGAKIQGAYDSYVANQKQLEKMYTSGDISAGKYQLGLQQALNEYNQTGGVKSGGSYSPFTAVADTDYMDIATKEADFLAKNPQKTEILRNNGFEPIGNGMYRSIKDGTEIQEFDAIKGAVMNRLYNDQNVMADLKQRERLGLLNQGETAEDVLNYVGDYLGATRQVYNTTVDQKLGNLPKNVDGTMGDNNKKGATTYSFIGDEHFFKKKYPDGIGQVKEFMRERNPDGTPTQRAIEAQRDIAQIENLIQNDPAYRAEKLVKENLVKNALINNEKGVNKMVSFDKDKELSFTDKQTVKKAIVERSFNADDVGGLHGSDDGRVMIYGDKIYLYKGDNSKAKRYIRAAGMGAGYTPEQLKSAGIVTPDTFIEIGNFNKNNYVNYSKNIDVVNKNIQDIRDAAFNKATEGQYMKYGFSGMDETKLKKFEKSFLRNINTGGMTNYEILNAKNWDIEGEAEDIEENLQDVDKYETTSKEIFNMLKSADPNEVTLQSLQSNPVSNTPSVTLSFRAGVGEDEKTYEIELGLDKNRNYDRLPAGESQVIEFLEKNFDEAGQALATDFRKGINYKDLHVGANRSDFQTENSKPIKKTIITPTHDEKLAKQYGKDYDMNIYRNSNTGKFKMVIKDSKGEINNTMWNDFINFDDVKLSGNNEPKSELARKIILNQLVEDGSLNFNSDLSPESIDDLIRKKLSDQIETSDRFEMYDLLSLVK